jgi:hypothetical protein
MSMTDASGAPVLAYDRPLPPGTVRIRRSGAAVYIAIAPDTPKRAAVSLVYPVAASVAAMGILAFTIAANGTWMWSVPFWLILLVIGGGIVVAVIRQSADPIVFTADPQMLRVQNALDTPPDRTLGVFEIAALRLRPHPVFAGTLVLEVATKGFPDRPAVRVSLLASPSFETLDKIGRTLAKAMGFGTPVSGAEGWQTGEAAPPPLPHAIPAGDAAIKG